MKRASVILLIFLVAMICGAAAQTAEWQQIKVPPLPAFHPQEPKRVELPNGMVIFLQEDHELPLIDGIARIRGGVRSEPANKVGLVEIYSEVWRTGGARTQTGDQLDDYLEIRAAKVESGSNVDSTTLSWSSLKTDFDDVFKVFAELLREPEFREDKVDLAQREAFDAISRRNDDVGGIAVRESTKLAYGAQNPYARVPEYATVAAVTRQDLIDWHHAHVHPNNIILGIAGDFDSSQMEAKLRQAFGAWPKGPAFKEPEIEFHPAKPGYYLIPKEDVNQSSIRMVELGTTRRNPDYYAIEVFNEAFGGSFSSRLFRKVPSRNRKGANCRRRAHSPEIFAQGSACNPGGWQHWRVRQASCIAGAGDEGRYYDSAPSRRGAGEAGVAAVKIIRFLVARSATAELFSSPFRIIIVHCRGVVCSDGSLSFCSPCS